MIAAAITLNPAANALDPIVQRIIGQRVRGMIRTGAIAAQDAEDVEQDLLVRVLQSATAFDPELSHPYVFATVIVDRAARNLLRDRRAEKRNPERACALQDDVARDCRDRELIELRLDVAAVLDQISEEQRALAERLKEDSVSVVARDLNVPRTSLYREVRKLRRCFEALASIDG